MNKLLRLIILTVSAVFCCAQASAAFKTFYSKVVVSADADGGLVYVSNKNSTPAESAYGKDAEKSQNTFELANSNTTHTYYVKARIASDRADNMVFAGWYEGNTLYTMESEFEISVTTSNSDKNNPLTKTFKAHFIEKPAITLETTSPAASATASPEVNRVGDEVTLTATVNKLDFLGNPSYQPNLMFEFESWIDESGNVLSTDPSYTFTITEPKKVIAKIKDLSEKPRNGQYYRIRNIVNRVMTLEGNYSLKMPGYTDKGIQADYSLLRWALPTGHDFDRFPIFTTGNRYDYTDDDPAVDVESMPSTIFYITGSEKGENLEKVSLASQGVDSHSIMNSYLTIKPMCAQVPGYYYFYATSTIQGDAGVKMRLQYVDSKYPACDVYVGHVTDADSYSAMALQPVDEEHMDYFFFGAKPEESMWFEGGYWTSMYTAFPYECRDGVEAYYVKETVSANGVPCACLERVPDDCVPASTAVLLKCRSLVTKENRLLPLAPDTPISPVEGNLLKGQFQLYTDKEKNGRVAYNESDMRLLGISSDGEVGFYKPVAARAAAAELPANRAYLDLSSMDAAARSEGYKLVSDAGGTTSIDSIESDGKTVRYEGQPVYDLSGRRVMNPVAGKIYVVAGQKVVW